MRHSNLLVVFRVPKSYVRCEAGLEEASNQWSEMSSGRELRIAKASDDTSPHSSRTRKSKPTRVWQDARRCQPVLFLRGLPLRFCNTHCSCFSTTRQPSFSVTVNGLRCALDPKATLRRRL
jgi:hypothetical protein